MASMGIVPAGVAPTVGPGDGDGAGVLGGVRGREGGDGGDGSCGPDVEPGGGCKGRRAVVGSFDAAGAVGASRGAPGMSSSTAVVVDEAAGASASTGALDVAGSTCATAALVALIIPTPTTTASQTFDHPQPHMRRPLA
jgi:hypothetical protein